MNFRKNKNFGGKKMKAKWKLKEKSTGELTTSVSGDIWKKAQEKAFHKLSKNVDVKGFRKGQVPEAIARKHIGKQNVLLEAVDEVANDALREAINEHNLDLVARPQLDLDEINEDNVIFKFIVTVKPEVTLGAYKNLAVKKESAKVSGKEIDDEVKKLQERNADLVIKEKGKVENGDTAVIDFEGFLNDIPFEGGKGDNYPLVIGSGSFIPGFEEQVIGMKLNDSKDIQVTFPEQYQSADLAGKAVIFKVKVNEIKSKELPKLDDELVKEANIENVQTVAEYKAYIKKNLETSKQDEVENNFVNELLTKVVDASKVEIPVVMIEEETDVLMRDFAQRLQSQGLNLEQYSQLTGQDEAYLRTEMAKDAENKVKVRLILEAIAKAEKIEASKKEIEAEYDTIASAYSMDVKQVKELISSDALGMDIQSRKALDLIKNTAKTTGATTTKEVAKTEKKQATKKVAQKKTAEKETKTAKKSTSKQTK